MFPPSFEETKIEQSISIVNQRYAKKIDQTHKDCKNYIIFKPIVKILTL
jgi:hypothetical protein